MKRSVRAEQELRRRTMTWAARLRVSPRVVRVQEMNGKWGSCSAAGTLTLARDLIDEQKAFQEFVIVHELLHLRVPSHGRLFKALMSAHLPGWRRVAHARSQHGQARLPGCCR